MPQIWEHNATKVAVGVSELLPAFYKTYECLKKSLQRYESKPYGIKRLQRACYGRPMLIDFDTLSRDVQQALGDPRKVSHWMERVFQIDQKASDFYKNHQLAPDDPTSYLKGEYIEEYTVNASVLQAVRIYRDEHIKANKKAKKLYEFMTNECQAFQEVLKTKYDGMKHTLPRSDRQFREVFDGFFAESGINYEWLISGKLKNDNARKIAETKQHALLRKLLGHANNFNYAQVMMMYNEVAGVNDWKPVTRRAVENFADANKLNTEAGRRGKVNFDNTLAMQHKRRQTGYPMLMWSIDGWDVELLYQRTDIDKNGNSVTTYHNRPTIIVVLDPYSSYPIGYAIGDHETPALIRQAVRNAITHTAELTGAMLRPHQFQSDHYGNGALVPFFESASKHYIPARIKNAKAKPVEKYFHYINTNYCQYLNNWSGHNANASKDNQPNTEWKNEIRHSFPDWQNVVAQVEMIMQTERNKKRGEYLAGLDRLPADYKHVLTTEQFLFTLGEIKERTSRMGGNGLVFDIRRTEYSYDSFDINFRRYTHIDWQVRYNPADMRLVLATNEDANVRFLLEEKLAESGNIAEWTEQDNQHRARIDRYNKELTETLMQESEDDYYEAVELLTGSGNDTLSKMLIVDSMGQHKDRKNAGRALPAKPRELKEKQDTSLEDARRAYIDEKVNLSDYLD